LRIKRQFEQVKKYYREFIELRRRNEHMYAIERSAQLLLQSFLDLGATLSTFLGEAKPDTYRGIARYLSKKLHLNPDEANFLESLAGFRNILIHGYAAIDEKLEEKAFSETEERLPRIIEKTEALISNLQVDPPEAFERLASIFEKKRVRYAILFGSMARRGAGKDYDIAISAEMTSALELGGLLVEIAEALNVHEDRIDLVLIEHAPKHLVHTIIMEGKVIYGSREEAYSDLAKHYIEYLDMNETLEALKERKPSTPSP